jgi:hypothetical protein
MRDTDDNVDANGDCESNVFTDWVGDTLTLSTITNEEGDRIEIEVSRGCGDSADVELSECQIRALRDRLTSILD